MTCPWHVTSEHGARGRGDPLLDGVERVPVVVEEHEGDPVVGERGDRHRRVVRRERIERAERGETVRDGTRAGAMPAAALVDDVRKVGLGAGAVEAGTQDVAATFDDPAGDHRRDPGEGEGVRRAGMVIAISPTLPRRRSDR